MVYENPDVCHYKMMLIARLGPVGANWPFFTAVSIIFVTDVHINF